MLTRSHSIQCCTYYTVLYTGALTNISHCAEIKMYKDERELRTVQPYNIHYVQKKLITINQKVNLCVKTNQIHVRN